MGHTVKEIEEVVELCEECESSSCGVGDDGRGSVRRGVQRAPTGVELLQTRDEHPLHEGLEALQNTHTVRSGEAFEFHEGYILSPNISIYFLITSRGENFHILKA